MRVLGIETSCDETAAALVRGDGRILAERLASQTVEHAPYGGVVPEIAARAHVSRLDHLIAEVMAEAKLPLGEIDAVAATAGPGLIGGLLVGLSTAKAIASILAKPLLAVNHLEGHALSARLVAEVPFPYLLLLVSGGHCQLQLVRGVGRYDRLGTTIDDAVGEAFDKTAILLGLGFPGGPAIERAAADGRADAYPLPRPMRGREGADFSFSGLKTAVRYLLEREPGARPADVAASFQAAVVEVLVDRTRRAIAMARARDGATAHLVVAGGVAANCAIRGAMAELAASEGLDLVVPPPRLCTDNAVMIAWAGVERLRLGLIDDLSAPARARWPLDPDAKPAPFAGVKA
ncbi:MAG: tRNA (adenosine(37)-N6)-threonylcarbamoyltransferase complex transferase subunit TsaD [Alphaproteobacteria bacterium]